MRLEGKAFDAELLLIRFEEIYIPKIALLSSVARQNICLKDFQNRNSEGEMCNFHLDFVKVQARKGSLNFVGK